MITYDISGGSENLELSINDIRENVLISIQTDATYNGTTDTVDFEHTVDGSNWHPINDVVIGTPLTRTLTGANLNLFEISSAYYGNKMRAVFTAVNGTVGILTISISLKN